MRKHRYITATRIVHTGIVNLIRNISLVVAAMAVMVVTLTIVLFSLIANATFTNTIGQITDKINVSVYLKDTASETQAKDLLKYLDKQPEVKKTDYLNKKQALDTYIMQNKGNTNLVAAATQAGNPIPATIHVYPKDLNEIQKIKDYLSKPEYEKLQTAESPSYNGDRKVAIDNITHATNVLRKIGAVTVVVFAVICALIIFNTIQMAIFNRRDEITIMRLLGASTTYIRGPFIVEAAVYGLLSGVLSILIVNSAFLASSTALQASSLGLLDIQYANTYFTNNFFWLLLAQCFIGIALGTVSAIIATRRYLKFKTK